jgi:DNA-binding transcriptional MerR regulator
MSSQLPPKLYFRIGEVAGLVGVEPHVLRYWEREFRSIRPTKSAKGQRVYSRRDVENLIKVKDLLYAQGFTIAGARKKLTRPEGGSTADAEFVTEVSPQPEVAAEAVAAPVPTPPAFRAAHAQTTLVELRAEIVALLGELG